MAGIQTEGVEIEEAKSHDLLKVDSLVVAAGFVRKNRLMFEIEMLIWEVYVIGDAKEPEIPWK